MWLQAQSGSVSLKKPGALWHVGTEIRPRRPAASPEKIKWAYRAFGPFSLPGRAYGVYAGPSTLRFFSQLSLIGDHAHAQFSRQERRQEVEIDLSRPSQRTDLRDHSYEIDIR